MGRCRADGQRVDPGKRHGFYGSLVQIAAPIGLLLANGMFAGVTWWLDEAAFLSWVALPCLSSALLIAVGLYIRMGVTEHGCSRRWKRKRRRATRW